jgi:hypothetical protein
MKSAKALKILEKWMNQERKEFNKGRGLKINIEDMQT